MRAFPGSVQAAEDRPVGRGCARTPRTVPASPQRYGSACHTPPRDPPRSRRRERKCRRVERAEGHRCASSHRSQDPVVLGPDRTGKLEGEVGSVARAYSGPCAYPSGSSAAGCVGQAPPAEFADLPVTDVTLPSGLRIIVEPIPGVPTVAVGVWFEVGSRDEPESCLGVAHFVEHLLFKGSVGRDARALAEAMDRLGGQFNAFTSKEHTCFHARTLREQFVDGVHLLADLVLRARLQADDIARERTVILSELAMIADDPGETADELFARSLWGASALGRPAAGTIEGVQACDARMVRGFYQEHYVGQRAVIAVAGGVEAGHAVDVLSRAFADLPPGSPRPLPGPVRPAIRSLRAPRTSEQAHLIIGAAGPALADPRRFAAELWISILGGSPSSRLFQAVREDLGLCYDVGAAAAAYGDAGEVVVFLAAAPTSVREAAAVMLSEVRRLTSEGVTETELSLHKAQWLAGLWMGLEGTEARMGRLGRQAIAHLPLTPPTEAAERLAAVTVDEVDALSADLGDPAQWACAYVGPKRGTPAGWNWVDVPAGSSPV